MGARGCWALGVILRNLVYPVIWSILWSTLHKVPWVLFLCVYLMFLGLPSMSTLFLERNFLLEAICF